MTPLLPCMLALLAAHFTLPESQGEVIVASPVTRPYIAAIRDGARGDLASARRGLSGVLRADPRHTSARLRFDVLEAVATHVIDDHTAARLFQAVLYTLEDRTQEALTLLDSVVSAAPEYAEAYRLRGRTRVDGGDYHLAIADYSEAISRRPDFTDAYLNRANAYARLHDLDLAIRDYDNAIHLAPSRPDGYSSRGATYILQGRPDDALRDFDHAIRLDPGSGAAYMNKALLYERLGRLADAAATYQALIRNANVADSVSVAEAKRRLYHLQRN